MLPERAKLFQKGDICWRGSFLTGLPKPFAKAFPEILITPSAMIREFTVPLILSTGPGAMSQTTLGIVIFFGVSLATVLTLFIVPSFYHLLARRTGSPGEVANRLEEMKERRGTA